MFRSIAGNYEAVIAMVPLDKINSKFWKCLDEIGIILCQCYQPLVIDRKNQVMYGFLHFRTLSELFLTENRFSSHFLDPKMGFIPKKHTNLVLFYTNCAEVS